jgi:hypothetical protein
LTLGFDLNRVNTTSPFRTIPFEGEYFTADNLGNLFLVSDRNDLIKVNAKGEVLAKVNFKVYGKLESLDVSNPFELYAFYKEQQFVLILDNMLSVLAKLDLSDVSNGEVTSVCRSYDNQLWLYDASRTKLMKYDKTLNVTEESLPFATWSSQRWNPHFMIDNEQHVLLLDSNQGVVVFDAFGNYFKRIQFLKKPDIQVEASKVYYRSDSLIVGYDYKLFNSDTARVPFPFSQYRITKNRLYIQNDRSIEVY